MKNPFRRYLILTKNTPLPGPGIPRILVERKDHCVNCGICVSACVYGVHERRTAEGDPTRVAEPKHEHCVACQRCVNECPMDALELHNHPEFAALGDAYYSPDAIETLLYEAETGRVPVSGQGYRGPFSGPGFDRIWTDMSEIVRPTRDGIYGREYIATDVELGRKPERLEFDAQGGLLTAMPPVFRIPVPMFFAAPPFPAEGLVPALLKAAEETGTFVIIDHKDFRPEYASRACVVRLTTGQTPSPQVVRKLEMVEIPFNSKAVSEIERLKMFNDQLVISIFIPFDDGTVERAVELARSGAEVLHIGFDPHGRTREKQPRFLIDALRSLDDRLVAEGLRDRLSVIVSGGIGRAEHVPKAIACGADAVGLRTAYAVALGLKHFDSAKGEFRSAEVRLGDAGAAAQRLKNLLSSWRDQLLEVLGAMGIREARRLQGETGRVMFYEELEAEFLSLFQPAGGIDPFYG